MAVPCYVAKQVEDTNFVVDRTSAQPIVVIHGGRYRVPFAVANGDCLDRCARTVSKALLKTLAEFVVAKGWSHSARKAT